MTNVLENLIERNARSAMRFHSFAKEWKSAIIAVWILKFFTAAVSIYAGLHYLAHLLGGAIGGLMAGYIAAGVLLFLLETINGTALFKGFKFALRRRAGTALAALFVALFSFSVSFYVSVEGIAAMQTAKADNTAQITTDFQSELKTRLSDVEAQISAETRAAEIIESNPQGWQGGKRSVLTTEQLTELSQIRAKIADLRATKDKLRVEAASATRAAVSENKQAATNEGAKYYNVVAILMVVQLFANFGLTFFYAKVYTETEKQAAENEDLTMFAQGLFGQMYSDIKTRYANLQNQFALRSAQIFSEASETLQPVSSLAGNVRTSHVSGEPTQQNSPRTGVVGFGAQRTQQQPIAQTQQAAHTPTQVPTSPEIEALTQDELFGANYYYKFRPALGEAIETQAAKQLRTTNRELAKIHGCSEATVRNCRRAILESKNL